MPIRPAQTSDAHAIAAIYNHFILTTCVTFEEEAQTAPAMAQRIQEVQAQGLPWLVAEEDGVVIGYAYATPWRARRAYRYSVESTIYLAEGHSGQGRGTLLYTELIEHLRAGGYHLVIGGIALPNAASVALHAKLGFEKVAQFREVGFKQERWLDVGYWQKTLS